MKVLFFIISIFFISTPSWSETVTIDDLKEKNGFYYKKFSIFSPLDSLFRFTGIVEGYHKSGNLDFKFNFKDGGPKGLAELYYENGQLQKKGNFKQGMKEDGLWEYYYENGQLRAKTIWNYGKRDGLREFYYKNGQLKFKGYYTEGKKEGLWEYFNMDGSLKKTETWKNGESINCEGDC